MKSTVAEPLIVRLSASSWTISLSAGFTVFHQGDINYVDFFHSWVRHLIFTHPSTICLTSVKYARKTEANNLCLNSQRWWDIQGRHSFWGVLSLLGILCISDLRLCTWVLVAVCVFEMKKKNRTFILKSPYCLSKLPVRLERIVCLTKCQSNKLNRLPVEEAGVGFFFFLKNLHFTFLQCVEGFVLWALRSRSEIFRWNSFPTFQSIYLRIF